MPPNFKLSDSSLRLQNEVLSMYNIVFTNSIVVVSVPCENLRSTEVDARWRPGDSMQKRHNQRSHGGS